MTQSDIFKLYMLAAWNGTEGDDVVQKEDDAIIVAGALGAKPQGQVADNDDDGVTWLFPDGSRVDIMTRDGRGSGFAPTWLGTSRV